MPEVRLSEVLRGVPAAVEDLEVTFLFDMFVAVEVSGDRQMGPADVQKSVRLHAALHLQHLKTVQQLYNTRLRCVAASQTFMAMQLSSC